MKITDDFIAATELILTAVGHPDHYPKVMQFIDENFQERYEDSEDADCHE